MKKLHTRKLYQKWLWEWAKG